LYRKNKNGFDQLYRNEENLSGNFIHAICPDQRGQLWLATADGLKRLANGKVYTELTSDGTAYDRVNAILEDREGNIWIGTKEGLTRLRIKPCTAITKKEG